MSDNSQKELVLNRIYDAPRTVVFSAWVDPKHLSQWWGPDGVTNPDCRVDARVGGEIYIVMLAGSELGALAGQRWPTKGIIQEIKEPEKLVFTNQAIDEASGNVLIDGVTTVLLEETDNKTKLTLKITAKGMSEQAPQMLEGMETGWNQSLDKLSNYLAKIS